MSILIEKFHAIVLTLSEYGAFFLVETFQLVAAIAEFFSRFEVVFPKGFVDILIYLPTELGFWRNCTSCKTCELPNLVNDPLIKWW